MTSPSNHSPPFSPVGSFIPREEFQRGETRESAVASLTLSGTGGIRVTGVQQELIYYLDSLFARPSNFVAVASPPPSSSHTNVVPSSTPATPVRQTTELPPASGHPPHTASAQAPHHQHSGSTTASSNAAAPSGPPIWRAGLLHSAMLSGQSGAWEYELAGSPWKVAASEELASVRLMIALVQTLGRFGWTLGAGVNAGRKRDDHHTWILTSPATGPPSSPSVATQAFAISFPRPNIVSVVDPPQNLTPLILTAIRAASLEAHGLAEEGWVKGTQRNPGGGSGGGGAYKFKLKGYTQWYRPGFPRARYEANTPALLAKLLSALDAAGMKLSVSCQIRPASYHRDLWIITSTTPVPPTSAGSQWGGSLLMGGLSRTGTATTTGSKTTVGASALGSGHPKQALMQHSRQASNASAKAPMLTQHPTKQPSASSIGSTNKHGSLLTKKNSLTKFTHHQPIPSSSSAAAAPPPSAYVPPLSASPRKIDFAALPAVHHQPPTSRDMSIADSGVAGVGAHERATPIADAFSHQAQQPEMVPMNMADGVSKFAEGRDSTVSMGETVDGEEASRSTVMIPIEYNGIQDPNRITEVTEPSFSARQTYATQKSWKSVVEPGLHNNNGARPATQFYTPGNEEQDQPMYPYDTGMQPPPMPEQGDSGGVPRLNEVPLERRRQGESLLEGED